MINAGNIKIVFVDGNGCQGQDELLHPGSKSLTAFDRVPDATHAVTISGREKMTGSFTTYIECLDIEALQ